jgi:dienelactone hydrolase
MQPSDSVYRFAIDRLKNAPADRSYLRDHYSSLDQWKDETRPWIESLLHYNPDRVEPEVTVEEETDFGSYVRQKISFWTAKDCRVPAYLLQPKDTSKPCPAVVGLHDHSGRFYWGKEKIVNHIERPPEVDWLQEWRYGDRGFASALAERGYVVLIIDALRFGERGWLRESWLRGGAGRLDGLTPGTQPYIDAYNEVWKRNDELMSRTLNWAGITYLGIMVWDDLRSVDYLASLPSVDADRIACMGLSMGGYRAAWLGAMDERIKCTCSVGYILDFRDLVPQRAPSPWSVVPGLYDHLPYPDLFGLCAPRDLLVIYGQNDMTFPPASVEKAVDTIANVYEKAGVPEKFQSLAYPVGHQFDLEMQTDAFAWLDKNFTHTPTI